MNGSVWSKQNLFYKKRGISSQRRERDRKRVMAQVFMYDMSYMLGKSTLSIWVLTLTLEFCVASPNTNICQVSLQWLRYSNPTVTMLFNFITQIWTVGFWIWLQVWNVVVIGKAVKRKRDRKGQISLAVQLPLVWLLQLFTTPDCTCLMLS